MSNIHPFDRAKEFPNYFEIMLESVSEDQRDIFLKKIQELIEQNINAIVKRLKLYYVHKDIDTGKEELSTADYFNELVKSMEHALKESPAKDDYNLEVYLSGGVVRVLLGSVYKQLYTNIQAVLEDEFEAAKRSKDKDEVFKIIILDELKNSTETEQAKRQELKTILQRLEDELKSFKTSKDKDAAFKAIVDELKNSKQQVLKTILQRLEDELKPSSIRSKDKDAVFETILAELETSKATDQEKQKTFEAILKRESFLKTFTKTPEFWLRKLKTEKSTLQSSYILGVGSDMDILYKLSSHVPENENKLNQEEIEALEKKIQKAGSTFLNSAASFFKLDDIEEILKNSLLPPGDVKPYIEQITRSMLQGGSAIDWLAFELSPKTGRKLIEPPLDLKTKAKLKQSIVESFIRGHYEYLESQIEESIDTRIVSVIRAVRFVFEDPAVTILDAAAILKELEDIENFAKRDNNGKIVLSKRALKQLEKLRRNTNFEGAHNLIHRLDPKNIVLLKFLEVSKQFETVVDGKISVHWPKYVQSVRAFDKMPTGLYQSKISDLLIKPETFIATFTDSGMLYHGARLDAVTAIVRGGFYISDATQGLAASGSGLYLTNSMLEALTYGESVFPLHMEHIEQMDTDEVKIINLDTMDPKLLRVLKDEAKEGGFLDINGEPEVHELLKIRYKIDIIIHKYVLIQNTAIIKAIQITDLMVSYGTYFEKRFMSNVQLGNKSLQLISENTLNLTRVNKFFKCYRNLCLLSGKLDSDLLSPVEIINNLIENVQRIEETQSTFNTQNTKLFIYAHYFLAKPDYIMAHLDDMFKCSNNNPDIIKSLEKLTHDFAIGFNGNKKEDHRVLAVILKNLILYSSENNLFIQMIGDLQSVGTQALNDTLAELISSHEITHTQMLTALRCAISSHDYNVAKAFIYGAPTPIHEAGDLLYSVYISRMLKRDKAVENSELTLLFNLMLEKQYPDNKGKILVLESAQGNMELVKKMCEVLEYSADDLSQALMKASGVRKTDANQIDTILYLLDRIPNIKPEVLDEVVDNALKNDLFPVINRLLDDSYTENSPHLKQLREHRKLLFDQKLELASVAGNLEEVIKICESREHSDSDLSQALIAASKAKKTEVILYLLDRIHNIAPEVLDRILKNAVKHLLFPITNKILDDSYTATSPYLEIMRSARVRAKALEPLVLASAAGQLEEVQKICESGKYLGSDLSKALIKAAEANQTEVILYFLDYIRNIEPEVVDAVFKMAIKKPMNVDVITKLLDDSYETSSSYLHEAREKRKVLANEKLVLASTEGKLEEVKSLCKQYKRLDVSNALKEAFRVNKAEIVVYLLEHHIDNIEPSVLNEVFTKTIKNPVSVNPIVIEKILAYAKESPRLVVMQDRWKAMLSASTPLVIHHYNPVSTTSRDNTSPDKDSDFPKDTEAIKGESSDAQKPKQKH